MSEMITRDLRVVPGNLAVEQRSPARRPVLVPVDEPVGATEPARGSLPVIPLEDGDSASGLRLGGTIGQGGMGLVRKATQLALDREVAAKTIRPDRRTEKTIRQLLQEAWVTGRLEHPNIVPIYSLGQTEDGAPVIVMKRIEGTRWTMMMHNPAARPEAADSSLVWNLKVLIQVCHAVEFAHQRGIIHRDLKPDNVMVGSFGEVYVLDWGLAVSLDDDGSGRLPQAADTDGIVGTPSYMAPEMFAAEGGNVGPWTDVFLLGAILHKILTGQTPHSGSLQECFDSANRSEPRSYDPGVPRELAELCRRAMHRDPGRRFARVRDFRELVEHFMEHSSSLDLAADAASGLARIESRLDPDTTLDEDQDQLLGEVIFGFEHALRIWRGNEDAARGLQRALELAFRQAVSRGRILAAKYWLERMPQPSPALQRELAKAEADAARREAHLEQARAVQREYDLRIGHRARLRLLLVSTVLLACVPWLERLTAERLGSALGSGVLLLPPLLGWIVAIATSLLARQSDTRISREIAGIAIMVAACASLTRYLAFSGAITTERLLLLDLLPLLLALAMFAVFIDHRLRVSVGLAGITFAAALHAPVRELPYYYALTHILGMGSIAWVWSRRPPAVRPRRGPAGVPGDASGDLDQSGPFAT